MGNKKGYHPKSEFKKGHKQTEKINKKISKSLKKYYLEHPEVRKNMGLERRGEKHPFYGKHHTPESNQKNREHNLGKKRTLESRIKQGNSVRGEKNHNYGKHPSQIAIQKNREWHLKRKAELGYVNSPETRKNMSIAHQGIPPEQWKGFISKNTYDQNFDNKFKRAIRQRDNQVCMNCGIHREKLTRALEIHHINSDRQNSIPQNCICLCRKCHNLTKQNRPYWKKLFQDKLRDLYGYQYTEKGDIILDFKQTKGE